MIEIEAPGNWEIELRSIQETEIVESPGTFEGSGDDVFMLDGKPDVIEVIGNEQERHFSVEAYEVPLGRGDLIVNTTDYYEGRNRISSEVELVKVTAYGEWQVTLEE